MENVDTIQMSLILGYNHYIVVVVVISNKRLSQVSTQERTIADEAPIPASIFLAAGQLMFEKLIAINAVNISAIPVKRNDRSNPRNLLPFGMELVKVFLKKNFKMSKIKNYK